jgi:hypothetical protein
LQRPAFTDLTRQRASDILYDGVLGHTEPLERFPTARGGAVAVE